MQLRLVEDIQETSNPDEQTITFDTFWRAYPRRVARKTAVSAWSRIAISKFPAIMKALEGHKKSDDWRKDSGKFIPYPASWLNGERWEDELESDITMGQCAWNINGNRLGEDRCCQPGTAEKRGLPYCKRHAERVL